MSPFLNTLECNHLLSHKNQINPEFKIGSACRSQWEAIGNDVDAETIRLILEAANAKSVTHVVSVVQAY